MTNKINFENFAENLEGQLILPADVVYDEARLFIFSVYPV